MKRKSQKRKRFLVDQIIKQQRWIQRCEDNGKSYADGQRGQDIRRADIATLYALKKEYALYPDLVHCS